MSGLFLHLRACGGGVEQNAELENNAYFQNGILNQSLDDYDNQLNGLRRDENEIKFSKLGVLFVSASLIMAWPTVGLMAARQTASKQTTTTSQRQAEIAETERFSR